MLCKPPNLVGNTGGANVGPVKSMQLPSDLLELLQTHGESRGWIPPISCLADKNIAEIFILPAMKKAKGTGPQQVQDFLAKLEHPLKKEILEVRQLVLAANPQLTEHIKWNAPSFCFQGEDRLTFNLAGTGLFRLIFHGGAKVRSTAGHGRLFEDKTGILEWLAPDRAKVRFSGPEDVQAKQAALQEVVNRWVHEMK